MDKIAHKKGLTLAIKNFAATLGFHGFKILRCEEIPLDVQDKYCKWLEDRYNASMDYLERNIEKRFNPSLLVPGAKSIIIFTVNYFPKIIQEAKYPQIAYYAYGLDYHKIIKDKLKKLIEYCRSLDDALDGRFFCDSAPVLERFWAAKAGLGWIGKNSLLIIPKQGSFFFISSLILNIELEYDETETIMPKCGTCTRCIDACPTKAIIRPYVLDSSKCLSYQTIENKGDISSDIKAKMSNRFFGCDICQTVCPWNSFAAPNDVFEFTPDINILTLDAEKLRNLTQENYEKMFAGSPIKRIKLAGIKRNIEALIASKDKTT